MPAPEVKRFPGFGIIYPDGKAGIKVVKTYTEAPKRFYNPDGSVRYLPPPPIIHELYGGGFVYQNGNPVQNRQHLENITDLNMQERALKWFDDGARISQEATRGVPELDPKKKKEPPETVFVLSSDPDFEEGKHMGDPIVSDLDQQKENRQFSQILAAIQGFTEALKVQGDKIQAQGEEIQRLKTGNSRPAARKEIRKRMKEKWKDPAFRAEMLKKNPIFKKKGDDPNVTAESSQAL